MDLPAVAYECKRDTDKKRLAQFPIRVQKVKRLRRQITELNRALRREKATVEYWYGAFMRGSKQTHEAIALVSKSRETTERLEKMYQSANSRADAWQQTCVKLGVIGFIVGLMVGFIGTLVLTSFWN
jgi:hypothetical protein